MKRIIASLILTGLPLWAGSCAASSPRMAEATEAPPSKVVLAVAGMDEPVAAAQPAADDEGPTTPTTAPAAGERPPLPAGHPDISSMMGQQQPNAAQQPAGMPAGHPDISAMMGQQPKAQPAPSPQQPQAPQQPQPKLPEGHPDISAMGRPQPAQPTQFTTLTIQAQQGTSGGPAIGADEVVVEIYSAGQPVAKIDTKLNDKGVAQVGNVPVGPSFQPLVTVKHQGIAYQAIGGPIESDADPVLVKVYEPTDQPVAWDVKMRHLVLESTEAGVQVVDMLAVNNATDRAYVGSGGTADAKPVTFELPLPAGATDVQLMNGFDNCCTKVEGGKVVNTMAIVPGTTQYQLRYTIPFEDGRARISTVAPADTGHLIVIAPEDGTTITAEGLQSGTANMGGGETRYFKANGVPANQAVTLTVSGTPTRAAVKTTAADGAANPRLGQRVDVQRLTKGVAAAGGLLIFLVGGTMLIRRTTKA